MNQTLVESLAQIIFSLSDEEQKVLKSKIQLVFSFPASLTFFLKNCQGVLYDLLNSST
jgi:hypothetical protein